MHSNVHFCFTQGAEIMGENQRKKSVLKKEHIKQIEEQVRKIENGSVTVMIHDGKATQLNTIEKRRIRNCEGEEEL